MTLPLLVLLGTRKGAFVLETDHRHDRVRLRGPLCGAMPIGHLAWDPAQGALLAGAGSPWYGPIVWRSTDLGATWSSSGAGLTFEDGTQPSPATTDAPMPADSPSQPASDPIIDTAAMPPAQGVVRVWSLVPAHGAIYAGVEPAGLFRSEDGGITWQHMAGLREHPTRPGWQPGNGGLMAHTIIAHPADEKRMWVGISSVGLFHTADGGGTWEPRNHGVRADFMPDPYPETGQCIHKAVLHPARPEVLFQQNHCGMYRSRDGGLSWQDIGAGLPSRFGFPIAVHPHDPRTIWTVPLSEADQGRYMPDGAAAVWMSRDEGDTWTRLSDGLPQRDAYLGVLREALATDSLDPAGLYAGTSTGQLFASRDEGRSWRLLADFLPPISSVETILLDG